ncbi:MAG: polyprenol monophosphomannose synthase, partial [Deltaproteobacteria bacterium]|nr:polyprenol monophosphomannose synthase [Deltaproteobacteria bacterium]
RTLIIVPTYNERENLPALVDAVFRQVPAAEILVVDDGSPDGTGLVADGLAASDPRVHVLHRGVKEGLGRAYVAGFRWALERDFAFVFEMDCDFSHRPEHLPEFLEAIRDADLVLGSRRVPGGGTRGWTLRRKLISWGGSAYARAVLGLPYRDLTGGFKCFRREVLEALDLDGLLSYGYCFQIELTWRAHLAGFRIREIPIVFPDRTRGQSKMSGAIFREALVTVWALRRSRPRG